MPTPSDSVPHVLNVLLRRARLLPLLALGAASLAACGGDVASGNQLGYQDGAFPGGSDLSTLQTIAIFVLVPLALLLGIAALVWLPGMVRGSRYRPSAGWSAAPMWFGGPPDPVAAVESASVGELTRGGAGGSW